MEPKLDFKSRVRAFLKSDPAFILVGPVVVIVLGIFLVGSRIIDIGKPENGDVKGVEIKAEPSELPVESPGELSADTILVQVSPTPSPSARPKIASASAKISTSSGLVASASGSKSPTSTIGHLPFMGDPKAKVVIVEYGDFQSSNDKKFRDSMFGQLKENYVNTGKIKFYFRHLPKKSNLNASSAALAAECASEQGKFWDYYDRLFSSQSDWSKKTIDEVINEFSSYGASMGLNSQRFDACLRLKIYKPRVDADYADAALLHLGSTPTFFIGSQKLTGVQKYDAFKIAIEEELAK